MNLTDEQIRAELKTVKVPYRVVGGGEQHEPMPDSLVELIIPAVRALLGAQSPDLGFQGATRERRVANPNDPEFSYVEYRWVSPWREDA